MAPSSSKKDSALHKEREILFAKFPPGQVPEASDHLAEKEALDVTPHLAKRTVGDPRAQSGFGTVDRVVVHVHAVSDVDGRAEVRQRKGFLAARRGHHQRLLPRAVRQRERFRLGEADSPMRVERRVDFVPGSVRLDGGRHVRRSHRRGMSGRP